MQIKDHCFKSEVLLFSIFLITLVISYQRLGNSFWIGHDNLNSEVIFKILPVNEGLFFNLEKSTTVNGFIGEVPKWSYTCSPFSTTALIFYFLPASWALLIITLLGRLLAFFGLYFLLRSRISEIDLLSISTIFFISLGFAFLPFYTIHGFTLMCLPGAMWLLQKLFLGSSKPLHLFLLFLYGTSGSFVLGGFAVIGISFGLVIYLFCKKKRTFKLFLVGVVLMTLGFILSDLGLFLQFFLDHDFASHRNIWSPDCDWPLKVVAYDIYNIFVFGQYHAPSHHLPILCFLLLAGVFGFRFIVLSSEFKCAFILLIFISIFHGFYKSEMIAPLKMSISILNKFQFDRVYFISGVLWIILFLEVFKQFHGGYRFLSLLFALGYFVYSVSHNEEVLSNISGRAIGSDVKQWNDYYYTNISSQLDLDFPNKKQFKVLHFGVDPAVGAFHGFQTIDGYHTNYPIALKELFMDIILIDLKKEKSKRESILNWGSNLRYFPTNTGIVELNWELSRKIGLKYVLSRYTLKQSEHIRFKKTYFDKEYDQSLHVYEIL